MVALKGTVTKKEDVIMEVSTKELVRLTEDSITFEDSVWLSWSIWLKSKGFRSIDVKVVKRSEGFFWSEYEDNGNHYSGYFLDRDKQCTEEDWKIFCAFTLLLNLDEKA